MHIKVVEDQGCPRCGVNGSPKVGHEDGSWSWKCLNPDCTLGYWNPTHGDIEERPSDEEMRELAARIKAEIDEQLRGKKLVRLDDGSVPGVETWGWE